MAQAESVSSRALPSLSDLDDISDLSTDGPLASLGSQISRTLSNRRKLYIIIAVVLIAFVLSYFLLNKYRPKIVTKVSEDGQVVVCKKKLVMWSVIIALLAGGGAYVAGNNGLF